MLVFGVPGFTPSQNSMQAAELAVPAIEVPQLPPEPVAVKVLPASPLGFLQEAYEVQKTEDIFVLQQSGGYAVQASLVSKSYQLGGISGVFSNEAVAEHPVPENLRVYPLHIVATGLTKPSSGSFFESFSFRTGTAAQEKGLVQALYFTFRLKASSVPSITSGAKFRHGAHGNIYIAAGAEKFTFRC